MIENLTTPILLFSILFTIFPLFSSFLSLDLCLLKTLKQSIHYPCSSLTEGLNEVLGDPVGGHDERLPEHLRTIFFFREILDIFTLSDL